MSIGAGYPYGATVVREGIQFCTVCPEGKKLILKIYDNSGVILYNIEMNDYSVFGNVYSVIVKGIIPSEVYYNYYFGNEAVRDPYAMRADNKRKWGEYRNRTIHYRIYDPEYDWQGDKPLRLPFGKVIGYMLHVRGFTRHSTSGVTAKGCFQGIAEKISYLKDLGITQIEMMPAYDYDECESIKSYKSSETDEEGKVTGAQKRINYWGFKEGEYFYPKPQLCYTEDGIKEFKDMVRALHAAGIELIMQFYFPLEVNRNLIGECLRFWQREYHVDGFHVFGEHLPMDVLATDPILTGTKLYYERYNAEGIFSVSQCCINKNLAEYNQDYMIDMRRFLKSDEDMLSKFMYRQRCNPERIKCINHLTSYDGFTLNDLVSYDYKHNENNGEENKDGTGYNYSWNCGIEGKTRKSAVLKLRMKQLKNAFCLLIFSQSMPMFMAGDEFMNTQYGNNNPYCQDNEITWLNWKQNNRTAELFEYVKDLIALRKNHGVLSMDKEATLLDNKSCGYPDISYHAEMAWYPQIDTHIRHIGTLLCGEYGAGDKADDYFYIATNMHWEEHFFALPKLQKGMEWSYCLDTDSSDPKAYNIELDDNGNKIIKVPARTVLVLISKDDPAQKGKAKRMVKKAGRHE